MQNNTNDIDICLFDFEIPYNEKELVAHRKKQKIKIGSLMMICSLCLVSFTVMSAIGKNTDIWVPILFGSAALASFVYGLIKVLMVKPTVKNDNKFIKFEFFENYLKISQNDNVVAGKQKALAACDYRFNKNSPYICKMTEKENSLHFVICTRSINFTPQYSFYCLPTTLFQSEEDLNSFKTFLKNKVGNTYVVKKK